MNIESPCATLEFEVYERIKQIFADTRSISIFEGRQFDYGASCATLTAFGGCRGTSCDSRQGLVYQTMCSSGMIEGEISIMMDPVMFMQVQVL